MLQRKAVGTRIKRLREVKGYSRSEVAKDLRVDVTSVAAWESAKYLPRERHRAQLARLLDIDLESLFNGNEDPAWIPLRASLIDTRQELPDLLVSLTSRTRSRFRVLRLAAPYITAAYVQQEWRNLISERLLDHSIEVQHIEIFYDLRRLQETLSNIVRYDGCRYWAKSYCPGLKNIAPAMGAYMFDEEEYLLGAYWVGIPPQHKPGLHLTGAPFRQFFEAYWDEIASRGTVLNARGKHDLSTVRSLALQLGLPPKQWKSFVDEALSLDIGDGAPPRI